jgi:ABC-type dipeptide/oligopeptide/nickel transport system ATPase subunit
MEKKIDEIKAKAEAVKAMQAAGASEDAINEAVKRMFGGQQQRKKK